MNQNNNQGEIVSESDDFQRTRQSLQTPTPKTVQWVMKYSGGYIKDEKQANYVLIGLVTLVIIISLFLIFSGREIDIPREALENPEYGLPEID